MNYLEMNQQQNEMAFQHALTNPRCQPIPYSRFALHVMWLELQEKRERQNALALKLKQQRAEVVHVRSPSERFAQLIDDAYL